LGWGTDLQHWAAWKVARVDISPVKRCKINLTKKSKADARAKTFCSAGIKEELGGWSCVAHTCFVTKLCLILLPQFVRVF
jgi:hypothetical protein